MRTIALIALRHETPVACHCYCMLEPCGLRKTTKCPRVHAQAKQRDSSKSCKSRWHGKLSRHGFCPQSDKDLVNPALTATKVRSERDMHHDLVAIDLGFNLAEVLVADQPGHTDHADTDATRSMARADSPARLGAIGLVEDNHH